MQMNDTFYICITWCLYIVYCLGMGFAWWRQHVQDAQRTHEWGVLVLLVAWRLLIGVVGRWKERACLEHERVHAGAHVNRPPPQRRLLRVLTRRRRPGVGVVGHASHSLGSLHRYAMLKVSINNASNSNIMQNSNMISHNIIYIIQYVLKRYST